MIVTIDGPAGAGKSTTARQLAERLGFHYLDTGAMYRVVTLVCLRQGVDLNDAEAVAAAARKVSFHFEGNRVFVDDADVTLAIRGSNVTHESRHIAANLDVRAWLVERQRELAAGLDIVTEGRDQGTVAFPDAECKFFLTADPQQRALRRQRELQARGENVALETILEQQEGRDRRDELREVGALKPAPDAIQVDTSALSATEVLAFLEQTVRDRATSS